MKTIYFVGAGGIGMSALERYFNAEGWKVGGYDRAASPLTEALIEEGIDIHFEDNIDAVDACFKNPAETLVCYTPAIPKDHGELCYFQQNGFQVMKRSQLLGLITREKRGLCVAGTHGKTTTSSMIAHMLKQSHVDCNAFLGGILKPYDSNLMLVGDKFSPFTTTRSSVSGQSSDLTVIEADEFDRSFHTLSPYMAVITACDPDHLDIYGTEQAYRESFAHFTSLVRPGGVLLKRKGVKVETRLAEGVRYAEYDVDYAGTSKSRSLEASPATADYFATNLRIGGGTILFDFVARKEGVVIKDMEPGVPAPINVENAVAALAICFMNGCTEEELRASLKSFGGAKRRFDFYIKRDDFVLMDDYAHHPDEIRACLTSMKELYKGRHLTVVFQPHLFSRTHDLVDGFAEALAIPDRTILLPIYPAREEPMPGVTSEWLLQKIQSDDKLCVLQSALVTHLANLKREGKLDVLVMMGAGVDIEKLLPETINTLK